MDTLSSNNAGWAAVKPAELKARMPKVAAKVAELRRKHGDAWVTEQIKASMRGVAGAFWAWEGGLEVGTPSEAQRLEIAPLVAACAGLGGTVMVLMAEPKEVSHGGA